jgi:hypothetical protein
MGVLVTDEEDDPIRCATYECDNLVKDEGDQCHECQANHDYWRRQYDRYGRREMEQQRTHREDMIAAGRAHLLPEGQREL